MGAVVVDDRMLGVPAGLHDHHRQAQAEAGAPCGQGTPAFQSRRYAGPYLTCNDGALAVMAMVKESQMQAWMCPGTRHARS